MGYSNWTGMQWPRTTNLKLFSNEQLTRKEANQKLDLLDIGLPGTPINSMAVDQAIKTGLALNATINKKSIFDRKLLYPDLLSVTKLVNLKILG